MKATPTAIPDVLIIEPKVFGDSRGFFFESFNQAAFDAAAGQPAGFVQDNHSRSARGVLRGLHYQIQKPQGKLVRVVRGAVFDVAVDIRRASPTFGRWVGVELTEDNHRQLWVPPGFAHGFVVTSESADFLYKTTEFYARPTSGPSCGTTPTWASTGRTSAWRRCCRPRTRPPAPSARQRPSPRGRRPWRRRFSRAAAAGRRSAPAPWRCGPCGSVSARKSARCRSPSRP